MTSVDPHAAYVCPVYRAAHWFKWFGPTRFGSVKYRCKCGAAKESWS